MEQSNQKTAVQIQWLGQSCFRLEADGYSIVLDPYEDHFIPGLSPLTVTASEVLCSHDHADHGCVSAVSIRPAGPSPFTVTRIASFHDDQNGALRGRNTIHRIECGGLKLAHLGDLGCMLNPEQIRELSGLDALLIPIGGYYTIDADQAYAVVQALRPRVVIPMHYRTEQFGFDVLDTADHFLSLFELVVEYPGDTMELTADTDPHTAVLTYEGAGA